jgi:hypothetical protein
MSMPVMDIRPVPVDMRYGLMAMDMVVRFPGIHPFVSMLMVLIVEMPMVMHDCFMAVQMPVLFPVKQDYSA